MTGLIFLVIAAVFVAVGIVDLVKTSRRPREFDRSTSGLNPAERTAGRVIGVALLCLALVFVFADTTHVVQARGVAVQTRFGKVVGQPLGPGLHWVNPVNDVEEFDASVKTLKFYEAEKNDDGSCLTVRLGNNTQACVDVAAQWNINHLGDVNGLYLQYKTFDNIHDNLVIRQLQSALNEVFGTYDPLNALGAGKDAPAVTTKTLQDFVRADLQRDLGSAILVDSVTIPLVHFDNPTEDRLRAFQQALADTRIGAQGVLTAQEQAKANDALNNDAATGNPGVQYQNCLTMIQQLAKTGQLQNLPPTFTCGGTPVGTLIQLGKK